MSRLARLLGEESPKEQMNHLHRHLEAQVMVVYASYGSPRVIRGVLSEVEPFGHIRLTSTVESDNDLLGQLLGGRGIAPGHKSIPFIGDRTAIIMIRRGGKVIYNNPNVEGAYNAHGGDTDLAILRSFGVEVLREKVSRDIELQGEAARLARGGAD